MKATASHETGRRPNAMIALPATTTPAACIKAAGKEKLNPRRSGLSASLNFCKSSDGTNGNNSVSSHNANTDKGAIEAQSNACILSEERLPIMPAAAIPSAIPTIFHITSASAAERVGNQT